MGIKAALFVSGAGGVLRREEHTARRNMRDVCHPGHTQIAAAKLEGATRATDGAALRRQLGRLDSAGVPLKCTGRPAQHSASRQ